MTPTDLLPSAVLALGVLAGYVARSRRAARARAHAQARLLHIHPPPQVDPAGAAALWAHLPGLLHRSQWRRLLGPRPHLCWEYSWAGRRLGISIWVPGTVPAAPVRRAVTAAWPGATLTTEHPVPPLPHGWVAAGGWLRPATAETVPLRTDHDTDPLRPLLAHAADTGDQQAGVVQICARPASTARVVRLRRAVAAARAGASPTRAARLLDLLTPGGTSPTTQRDPVRNLQSRAAVAKAADPLWEVTIRYGSAATSPRVDGTDRLARVVRSAAHATAATLAGYSHGNGLHRTHEKRPQQVLSARGWRRGFTLGVAELAALAHLPHDESIPGLDRARARPVAPPVELTGGGRGHKVLGHAEVGGRAVTAAVTDLRHHTHLLGLTGCGKSTLLTHLVVDDAKAGRGAVVIDPKGDLIVDILDRLPAHLADRVAVIDPWQTYSPTFNVLAGADHDLVVDNVVGIFRNIFSRHWGPRADDVLRAACLTLVRAGRTSLAIVPQLLNNPIYRAPLVADLPRDEADLGGFWSWYDGLPVGLRSQVVGPVLSRIRAFTLRPFVRATVAWPTTTLDMRAVLDGGVLLARIPKGELGEDTARLLGSFLVAQIWQAATARARHGQTARADTTLYLDEAHNFLTLPRALDEMLAEARGYRLSLVLAHQNLAQLPREIAAAVSANARNKLYFTVSPEDAHQLSRHTRPELDETDLARLDAFTAAARLMHYGRHSPACTLRTRAPGPVLGHAAAIRDASSARFAALGSPQVKGGGSGQVASAAVPAAGSALDSSGVLTNEHTPDPARPQRPARIRHRRRADTRGHP